MRTSSSRAAPRAGDALARFLRITCAALAATLALAACGQATTEKLGVTVLNQYPHDHLAFTQGLLLHKGYLYESTGLVGRSSLRQVDLASGDVIRFRAVPAPHFAEGLELVGEELLQLTWQTGTLLRYDLHTFEPVGQQRYEGEGWGLCYDGEALWMTNGSATLFKRDPITFEILSEVQVRLDGQPLPRLNELECVDGKVYANVWLVDEIVRIDPATGRVEALIDASSLREALGITDRDAVLNGIAYDPEKGVFLVTGKLWPTVFEVRFE
ncbi:MAG: glutaminyl-peptide cyclotransferase [Trueperaceae bacterium]